MSSFAWLRPAGLATLLISAAALGSAQTASSWRFWDTSAGMRESYTVTVTRDAQGTVLAKHGVVDNLSRLDGYSVDTALDPRSLGRIVSAADGDLWTFDGVMLRHKTAGGWTAHLLAEVSAWPKMLRSVEQYWMLPPTSAPHHPDELYKLSLCALGGGRVLVLFPDKLIEFNAATLLTRTVKLASDSSLGRFISLYQSPGSRENQIWVAGRKGVAIVRDLPVTDRAAWTDVAAPAGLTDFDQPRQGENGEVFVAASSQGHRVLMRFDGRIWNQVYRGVRNTLRGWRGADHDLWVQDGDAILRWTEGFVAASGRMEPVERREALSGIVLDVVPDSGGAFWVTTSQGLARYAPSLWRSPGPVRGADSDVLVNSIAEDPTGNVWFLSPRFLTCLCGQKWLRYALDGYERPPNTFTDTLHVLPDGRMGILSGVTGAILIFDPATKRFAAVRHPENRFLRTFLPRRDGGFFIQTVSLDNPSSFRLETFDGRTFRTIYDPGVTWQNDDLRTVLEAANGDLWIGGSSTLGVYSHGKYRRIGPAEGFHETGAFFIYEPSPGHILVGGRVEILEFDGTKWTTFHKGFDRVRNMIRSRDGTLWVASGSGAFRYRGGAWLSNTLEEGLPSSVVYRVYEDRQGRIWAGTTRGISLFHPEADTEAPRTILSEELNSRESAPDVPVHVVFSGLDKWNLTPSDRLLFSWRLDGGVWSEFLPVNSTTYRKPGGGAHRFEVRSMDRNGNIGPHPAALSFTVLVPWHQSTGFRTALAISLFLFCALLASAAGNYVHRGKLLLQLEASRQLEQDRKEILELIARREPLHVVLCRVACVVGAGETGAACVAATVSATVPESSFSVVAAEGFATDYATLLLSGQTAAAFSARVRAAMSAANAEGQRTPIRPGDLWNDEEYRALVPLFRSASTIPVISGTGMLLGALEVYWPEKRQSSLDHRSRMEAMAALAASAIENAQLYRELAHRAQYDSLTRLPNRLFFTERLHEAIDHARAASQKLALLYLDLDRFKQVNDSLGHYVGDELLKQVAGRLSGCMRKSDAIARMGGDEFMVLIEIRSERDATETARRLLDSLSRPVVVAGNELFVTASIGISIFPDDGEDAGTLQKHADTAMYRAKEQGKNRYQCFSREMDANASHRLDMDRYLRQALDQSQFELFYQPQLTGSGDLAGMEALLRLRHPQLGLLAPGDFISVAEESGLILEIGTWVLREVCRQSAVWAKAGLKTPKIAINVSTLQFAQADFAQTVARALRDYGVPGSALELELTESVVMVHLEESVRQMEKLRSLGLTIALDDFGTGYSSLSYLHKLPIDVLKIDRSFVREIDKPSGTLPLVHSIVDLAHNLGLGAVAEGVERNSQQDLLVKIGCDLTQGFLLSLPLTAADMERFMLIEAEPDALPLELSRK